VEVAPEVALTASSCCLGAEGWGAVILLNGAEQGAVAADGRLALPPLEIGIHSVAAQCTYQGELVADGALRGEAIRIRVIRRL
jgi:hypothetical protein